VNFEVSKKDAIFRESFKIEFDFCESFERNVIFIRRNPQISLKFINLAMFSDIFVSEKL
jgi:hypothetical protein